VPTIEAVEAEELVKRPMTPLISEPSEIAERAVLATDAALLDELESSAEASAAPDEMAELVDEELPVPVVAHPLKSIQPAKSTDEIENNDFFILLCFSKKKPNMSIQRIGIQLMFAVRLYYDCFLKTICQELLEQIIES
jgi:hypothetical protein